MDFLKKFKWLFLILIGILIGYFLFGNKVKTIEVPSEPQIIKEVTIKEVPVQQEIQGSISYQEKQNKDDADIKVIESKPKIIGEYIKEDGTSEKFEFPTTSTTTFDKENGQFVFKQNMGTTIDVTEIIDKLNEEERARHKAELEKQKDYTKKRELQVGIQGALGGFLLGKMLK